MDASPLVVLAHLCHAAVTDGFLPVAQRLGRPVVILTDHRLDHLEHFSRYPEAAPQQIVECDVFNPIGAIDVLRSLGIRPAAVFSNSDHLQSSAASVAQAFDLPGKDWRTCYAAKNKVAMRERMRELGLPTPWFRSWTQGEPPPADAAYPLIAKPREGVASMEVQLCASVQALQAYGEAFWRRFPGRPVLLEGYLQGPLFTLETLGDGRQARAIGGFDVRLSEPPHFVELEARWNGPVSTRHREQALAQVLAFGVNFGACHSEFVLTASGPVLIEINYRSIGDGREFMLDRMLDGQWFERILRLHLGEPLNAQLPPPRQGRVRYYLASSEGRLLRASDDRNDDLPGAHAVYRRLRVAGEELRFSHSNKDYLGHLSVVADSEPAMQEALDTIEPQLQWEITASNDAAAVQRA